MMRRVLVAVCVVLALGAGRASATDRASDQKLDAALTGARARARQAPRRPVVDVARHRPYRRRQAGAGS